MLLIKQEVSFYKRVQTIKDKIYLTEWCEIAHITGVYGDYQQRGISHESYRAGDNLDNVT